MLANKSTFVNVANKTVFIKFRLKCYTISRIAKIDEKSDFLNFKK